MLGFDKLRNEASMGTLMIVSEAPVDRAFTSNHWKLFVPSPKAFRLAEELGVVQKIGFDTYLLSNRGKDFKEFLAKELEVNYA